MTELSRTTSLIDSLCDAVVAEYPVHKGFLNDALGKLGDDEKVEFHSYLEYCVSKGLTLDYLAESYLSLLEDTLREQIYFMQHKEYRYSTLAEVIDLVYNNTEYMNRYMYGLAITDFLWSNHIEIIRFFKRTLPKNIAGKYLEVGPGHGHYMMTAMQLSGYSSYLGVDISSASIEQTRSIVDYFQPEHKSRLQLQEVDFLDAAGLDQGAYDAIVMGEVLEHVEQPELFLARIVELAKPEAYIFVTSCVNAPEIDHIYLWRTIDSLESMIKGCGLDIVDMAYMPYAGKTLEEAKADELPINVAYVLEKRG